MDDRETLIRLDDETSDDDAPTATQKEMGQSSKPIQDFGVNQSEEPSCSSSGRGAPSNSGNNHLIDDDQSLLLGNNLSPIAPEIVSN